MTPDNLSTLPAELVRSSRTFPVILQPAGAFNSIQRVPQAGVRFYIIESDSDSLIGIKTDKTQQELFSVGTGKNYDATQYFTALEFQNFSADVVTLEVFAGFGDYIDKRTTIVGNRLSSILPTIEPKTKPVAGAAGTIAATSGIALSGVPAAGQLRRKAVLVSNLDAALDLQLRDALGNVLTTIFPRQTNIFPISEACEIYNANGGIVALSYGEIWWMKP